MANPIFVKKFSEEITSLVTGEKFANMSDRMATRGDMIEEITKGLFSRYLPNRCAFGKGHIHDSLGGQSRQVDIVVFDRDSMPPICFNNTKTREEKNLEGFFPVESCWYAAEIKKKLNKSELRKAIENMESVRDLKDRGRLPARLLFAYSSDLNGSGIKKDFDRYKEIDNLWNQNPAINVICIIGKGYIFAQPKIRFRDNKKVLLWKYVEPQKDGFEAACCLSGIINTITGQPFGSYLFDEDAIPIIEEIEL